MSANFQITIIPAGPLPVKAITPIPITLPILTSEGVKHTAGKFVPSAYVEPTPVFGSEGFLNYIDTIPLRALPQPGPVPATEKHFRLYEDYSNALDSLINIAASDEAKNSSIAKDLPFLKARYGVFRAHIERRRKRRDEDSKKARIQSYSKVEANVAYGKLGEDNQPK